MSTEENLLFLTLDNNILFDILLKLIFLTVIKIHHFFLLKAQYQFLQNSHSRLEDISSYRNDHSQTVLILIFLFVFFPLSGKTNISLVLANTKYIVWLSFPGFQP